MDKILVTSALIYANGPVHIGHVAGAYLPADIFVRFHRLLGSDIIFVSGTDEHGAPVSIKAEKEGKTPRELVNFYHDQIDKSFAGLNISFDNFSGTARPYHHKISQKFFKALLDKDFVVQKSGQQFYCEHDQRFLADRYVEGVCPFCSADGARGDQCDSCGKLINSIELKEPKCKICGKTPIIKETSHWYLELPKFENMLKEWLTTKSYWKDNVINFIMGWLNDGLIERAITRDIDWGIPLPLPDTEGKVLYVWFDAPIGYISSTVEWADKIGEPEKWKDYWFDPDCKLIHFIGKDNIPFHAMIWPAVLMEQNDPYILPYDIPANEYLNIEGSKVSTSRNYAIWVDEYLKYFNGELLRYVLAANAPETRDADFTWQDFQVRINNELANILGNLANRVFTFSIKFFAGEITKPLSLSVATQTALSEAQAIITEIEACYRNYRVRKTTSLIMDIARIGNRYFDERAPWKAVKTDKSHASETLYLCLELLRMLSIVMSPILPVKMLQLRKMMNLDDEMSWKYIPRDKTVYYISNIETLFTKITDEQIDEQIQLLEKVQPETAPLVHKPEIEYDDFMKMELRIVKVLQAEKVKKSKKLLKLMVKIGSETREIVSGISLSYSPEDLIGKKVVMLINLKPRQIMGITSQGMILAAADKDNNLSLITPMQDIDDGSEVS
ncbi:MAG: methionine--tRNA ligase [Candidatus Cloacimonetes bacterium]|nr:methionine--tRNA ligase [Candidatus Cloacimonadota bacterium]